MSHGSLLAAIALVGGLLSAPAAHAAPSGCAPGIDVAARMVHPRARVVRTEALGELRSALLSLPLVVPGVRHRLVRAGGLWCDAVVSFNVIAPGLTARRVAEAFARLAAAPWFDGVTVLRAAVDGGVVRLETHARTNGVVAEWTVATDAAGVRDASWTATGVGRPPFDAEWEGVTPRPGSTVRYTRQWDGTIRPSRSPGETPGAPGILYDTVPMSDGFVVEIRTNPGGPGTPGLDVPAVVRDVAKINYEDFLSWGLHGGWIPADRGVVQIDDEVASYCGACVIFQSSFNVHIASDFIPFIETIGFDFPDDRLGYSTVIGHEIFHNLQFAYGGERASVSIIEGTARFQESLHDDSVGNHQPGSALYAPNQRGSTCNDYVSVGVTAGPAAHSYDACRFWLSWYADHGLPGLIGILERINASAVPEAGAFRRIVEEAGGTPYIDALARFAGRLLVPRGMVWGPADGTGSVLDWGELLRAWRPPAGSTVGLLRSAGMAGFEVEGDVLPVALGLAGVYVIRDDGWATTVESLPLGSRVAAPNTGARAWVVAIALRDDPTPLVLTAVA